MKSDFSLSVAQAHKLEHELLISGWSAEDVNKLGSEVLRQAREIILGRAEINILDPIIDCDAHPFVPDGYDLWEHKKGGQWRFDPSEVEFYVTKESQLDPVLRDHRDKRVLNANVLDYLLMAPQLIPEEWKGKQVMFWGTLYGYDWCWRVRGLSYREVEGWCGIWSSVGDRITTDKSPAAILAS